MVLESLDRHGGGVSASLKVVYKFVLIASNTFSKGLRPKQVELNFLFYR